MYKYGKKDIDEIIRLLRKSKANDDTDIFTLAIQKSQSIDVVGYRYIYLLDFINAQISLSNPPNNVIYESLRFINAEVVDE